MRRLQPMLFETRISPHLEAVNLILDDNDTQMLDVINLQDFNHEFEFNFPSFAPVSERLQ